MQVFGTETDTFQNFFGLCLHRVAVQVFELFLQLRQFLHERVRIFGLERVDDLLDLRAASPRRL